MHSQLRSRVSRSTLAILSSGEAVLAESGGFNWGAGRGFSLKTRSFCDVRVILAKSIPGFRVESA